MGDITVVQPDHRCLFAIPDEQHGFFTSAQARNCGFSRSLLSHLTKAGHYLHVRRGLYRLQDYPGCFREEVVAAWLAAGPETAVISHESALDLLELSDVIPYAIHLTVPRTRRNLPKLPGVRILTTQRPFGPLDLVTRDGMRVTSPTRTILDTAEYGTAPEQVEMAVRQALSRGIATKNQLLEGAKNRSSRVQRLVLGAIR